MASNNNEYNQIDELLQTGQISNAVEFYNYFKNKSSAGAQTEQPAVIPTSSSSSSISSYSGKRSKRSKANTLSDYASMLNVPVQSHPKPKFKKTCSSNNLAVYANPSLSPAISLFNLSNNQFNAYMPRRSTIYDEYIMDQKHSNEKAQNLFPNESISSVFLNSTNSYYQKYKLQQSVKPADGHDDKDMDKRKEEAINRIIRNERIKEIRMKMYEYDLLKEYQNLDINQTRSIEPKSFEDFSSVNENVSEDGLDEQRQKPKQYAYFNRTYGNRTIFDEYRSNMPDNEDNDDDGDDGDDGEVDEDEEEDCESGIEDDHSINKKKTRINFSFSGINLAPNQSRFQLKISIISAEVKNIINVLKQVRFLVSMNIIFLLFFYFDKTRDSK